MDIDVSSDVCSIRSELRSRKNAHATLHNRHLCMQQLNRVVSRWCRRCWQQGHYKRPQNQATHICIFFGRLEVVQLLLAADASVKAADIASPLQLAARKGPP
jgi:hypothetical protein